MTDTSKVLQYLEQAAARAEDGEDLEPTAEADTTTTIDGGAEFASTLNELCATGQATTDAAGEDLQTALDELTNADASGDTAASSATTIQRAARIGFAVVTLPGRPRPGAPPPHTRHQRNPEHPARGPSSADGARTPDARPAGPAS